ncbi:MATE family efflux transporter [Chakrabartyella piscis]|uniref:MATE family efflux transporter n=1 Tax=Chakrabartyella piscis TaxID=2918914 RepID=UPI0029589C12|nr:MATE family efflux transporter [Chakrabartyella piscis]
MENNRIATMPMKKLVLSSSIPVMFSLALQAVYNIVDSIFVSNMDANGEEALNALTLAFPVHMFIVAICIGTGVGASVLVSRYLGERNTEKTKAVTKNTVFLGLILTTIIVLFGVFCTEFYIGSQTVNPIIYEMGVQYLRITCIISFGSVYFAVFEKLLQSTGHSLYSTIAQVTGSIVNIILDPIMIYGWFGVTAMGVRGAAYATVIGQTCAFLLAYHFHRKYNQHISDSFKGFRPDCNIIRKIYVLGFPAIVAQALISIMAYCLNVIFVLASESFVTVYGLYYKIQQFVIMAIFGLRDATMPIVSFTYGSKNKERMKECIKYLFIYALSITLIGTILFELFAVQIASAFGLSGTTMELCIKAIQIVSLSFVFVGINVASQTVFQSVGSGVESLVVSFLRQIILVLPVAYGFTRLVMVHADYSWSIWLTFIIAEGLTAIVSIIYIKGIYAKKINTM